MLMVHVDTGASPPSHEAEEAIQQLHLDLQMYAPGAVSERSRSAGIAQQRFAVELTTLVIAGVKLGVFSGLVDIIKSWLQNRPKAEITLRASNGSELKITHATPKQAIELFASQNEPH